MAKGGDDDDDDDDVDLAKRLDDANRRIDMMQGRIIAVELVSRWYMIGGVLRYPDPIAQLLEYRKEMLRFLPFSGAPGEDQIRQSAIGAIAINFDATELRLRDVLKELGRLPAD